MVELESERDLHVGEHRCDLLLHQRIIVSAYYYMLLYLCPRTTTCMFVSTDATYCCTNVGTPLSSTFSTSCPAVTSDQSASLVLRGMLSAELFRESLERPKAALRRMHECMSKGKESSA